MNLRIIFGLVGVVSGIVVGLFGSTFFVYFFLFPVPGFIFAIMVLCASLVPSKTPARLHGVFGAGILWIILAGALYYVSVMFSTQDFNLMNNAGFSDANYVRMMLASTVSALVLGIFFSVLLVREIPSWMSNLRLLIFGGVSMVVYILIITSTSTMGMISIVVFFCMWNGLVGGELGAMVESKNKNVSN